MNKKTARKLRKILITDGTPRATQGDRPLLLMKRVAETPQAKTEKTKRPELTLGVGRRLPKHSVPARLEPGEALTRVRGVWPSKGNCRARKRAWAGLSHAQRALLLGSHEALLAWATRLEVEARPKADLEAAWRRALPGEPVPKTRSALVMRLLEMKAA